MDNILESIESDVGSEDEKLDIENWNEGNEKGIGFRFAQIPFGQEPSFTVYMDREKSIMVGVHRKVL